MSAQLRGATAQHRPWTPEEKEVVRSSYLTVGASALARQLGRSVAAINHCAQRQGLVRHRRWTEEENEKLRMLWGERSIAELSRIFKRPESGIYFRAWKIGIRTGPPQGKEYIETAMRRTGFTRASLRRILRWAGVKVYRPSRKTEGAAYHFGYVDPFDVDDAVTRWCGTETLNEAAKRHGICPDTLARRLSEAGKLPKRHGKGKHLRVDSKEVDDVMAASKTRRSLSKQAKRVGVSSDVLSRWLKAEGFTRTGRPWILDDEVVDGVVARRFERPGCRAPARKAQQPPRRRAA